MKFPMSFFAAIMLSSNFHKLTRKSDWYILCVYMKEAHYGSEIKDGRE